MKDRSVLFIIHGHIAKSSHKVPHLLTHPYQNYLNSEQRCGKMLLFIRIPPNKCFITTKKDLDSKN